MAGGPAGFTRDFTCPVLLGKTSGRRAASAYGAVTHCGGPFAWPSASDALSHSPAGRQTRPDAPTTPTPQRLPAVTRDRFSLLRFRSPLLAESLLFSLPAGTEMFHFPASPPRALCVQARATGFRALPGFPIRTPSDHSSVGSSPRLIAASHVLHRLLVPRHPPCALHNLATKMLASTVQFSTYTRPRPAARLDARPRPPKRTENGRSPGPHSGPHHTTPPKTRPRPPRAKARSRPEDAHALRTQQRAPRRSQPPRLPASHATEHPPRRERPGAAPGRTRTGPAGRSLERR